MSSARKIRVLFYNRVQLSVASSRQWFYHMSSLLDRNVFDVSYNIEDQCSYDIVFLGNQRRHLLIPYFQSKYPTAKIGLLAPGLFPDHLLMDNIDFVILASQASADMYSRYADKVYLHYDFPESPAVASGRGDAKKLPEDSDRLRICYCGHEKHYADDIAGYLRPVLQKLAKVHDYELVCILPNASHAKKISGVKSVLLDWEVSTHLDYLSRCDIGLAPSYGKPREASLLYNRVRNHNRVTQFLHFKMASVASPLQETLQYYRHGEHVLYASSLDAWARSLSMLVNDVTLRRRLGEEGFKVATKNFSVESAVKDFEEILFSVFRKEKTSYDNRYLTSVKGQIVYKTNKVVTSVAATVPFLRPLLG